MKNDTIPHNTPDEENYVLVHSVAVVATTDGFCLVGTIDDSHTTKKTEKPTPSWVLRLRRNATQARSEIHKRVEVATANNEARMKAEMNHRNMTPPVQSVEMAEVHLERSNQQQAHSTNNRSVIR